MGFWDGLSRLVRRPPMLHVAIDEGSGPPVILLHGIASSSVTFEYVVPLLRERHRVVAVDLLGFGESPAPPDADYSVDDHVRSLHRTLRRLRLGERYVLVGHSIGAIIAARLAAEARGRVGRLVLVSPPVYFRPAEVGSSPDRAAMGLYYRASEFLRENKEFTMAAAAQLARLSPIRGLLDISERNWVAFSRSLQNSIETQSMLSDLARIDVPVQVVYGTLDPLLSPEGLRVLGHLRGVTVHPVQGVDHVIRPRMARVVATAVG